MAALQPRDIYYGDDECWTENGRRYCTRSPWNDWVRWVVLVVVVVGFVLLFCLCSCLTARRRRKAGRQPYYGTGWMARNDNYQQSQQPYYNNQYSQPAPPYSPPAQTGHANSYYGNNQGYYGTPYGQQQQGVELQQPQPTYGGDTQYAPPPGPPPNKTNV